MPFLKYAEDIHGQAVSDGLSSRMTEMFFSFFRSGCADRCGFVLCGGRVPCCFRPSFLRNRKRKSLWLRALSCMIHGISVGIMPLHTAETLKLHTAETLKKPIEFFSRICYNKGIGRQKCNMGLTEPAECSADRMVFRCFTEDMYAEGKPFFAVRRLDADGCCRTDAVKDGERTPKAGRLPNFSEFNRKGTALAAAVYETDEYKSGSKHYGGTPFAI